MPDLHKDKNGNVPLIPVSNYLRSGKNIIFESLGNLKQVVCGEDHSFVIDENCNLFGFGKNDRGQLGLGHQWEVEMPQLISDLKGKVKEIKISGDLNIAITNANELFIWPYENLKQTFKPLRLLMDKKIIINSVSCGKNFAIILSKQGMLYSFGKSNKMGELGLGDNKPRIIPEQIYALSEAGERITQISCGFKHTIAKGSNGKVYTWGNVFKIT
jgi:alpha-tubulin suppressor-like RCC1 family protein